MPAEGFQLLTDLHLRMKMKQNPAVADIARAASAHSGLINLPIFDRQIDCHPGMLSSFKIYGPET
jgi:hypothetical protein